MALSCPSWNSRRRAVSTGLSAIMRANSAPEKPMTGFCSATAAR